MEGILKEIKVWLATGNQNKVKEARKVLKEYHIQLEHYPLNRVEIQADDLSLIASYSLIQIPDDGRQIAVEDAGLFIEHYGGFPGPYSSYALRTLKLTGILKIMENIDNRKASYHSVIALRTMEEINVFRGQVEGRISHKIRGTGGFGYDPIFIPDEIKDRTFGEISEREKNAISHRARAFRKLGEWLSIK